MNNIFSVVIWFLLIVAPTSAFAQPCVILLHGLARAPRSMNTMENELQAHGYQTANIGYPSRQATIPELSEYAIPAGLEACGESENVNFVTHSMGGILVRDYYARHSQAQRPDAVVMLAPPNSGSEIIDQESYKSLGAWFNGPAGWQLSAKPDSFVNQLPAVDFPTGIIAGDRSLEPYNSDVLAGADDGKVSVASTAVEGMSDCILLHANHTFILQNSQVKHQVIYFFENGEFKK